MTDFEKTYQNYNPRAAALAEARALLTEAAKAAMADGTLPEAELPAFIVEIPADTKNGDIASNLAMAGARTWRKAPKMIADALIARPGIRHGQLNLVSAEYREQPHSHSHADGHSRSHGHYRPRS